VTRYFAIGLRDWVEIRSAQSPPRERTTHFTVKQKVARTRRIGTDIWGYGQYLFTEEEVKKKAPYTIFQGGTCLATLKKRRLARKWGVSVPGNSCIELTAEQAVAILEGEKE
jgi:hypothetical protein